MVLAVSYPSNLQSLAFCETFFHILQCCEPFQQSVNLSRSEGFQANFGIAHSKMKARPT